MFFIYFFVSPDKDALAPARRQSPESGNDSLKVGMMESWNKNQTFISISTQTGRVFSFTKLLILIAQKPEN